MVAAATLFWSALAGAAAVRALYRPHKAVMRDGTVTRCAGGPKCQPSMTIDSNAGVAPVFSVVRGRVLSATPAEIQIASADEPVIVTYRGSFQLGPAGRAAADVGAGQAIAHAAQVELSVARMSRDAAGKITLIQLEPAAWLAARGLAASAKRASSPLWCDSGRRMTVPAQVGGCGLRLPDPPAFALLPVSVSME